MKRFGLKLKDLRAKMNMTQAQLSTLSGIGHTTISYIESGQKPPSADQIERLCKALDVSEPTIVDLIKKHGKDKYMVGWGI